LEDYFIFRLTSRFVTDLSLQTSSLLLEINQKQWWGEMLAYLGISEENLGMLVESGQIIAPIQNTVAHSLGLSTSTLVVSGGMDQALGAVGAGNIAPGMVSEMTGGALALMATLNTPYFQPERKLPCQYHAVPGAYCLMPFGTTGGMALKWFRDEFFGMESANERAHQRDPYDLMTELAGTVQPGCDGLVMLPHLEGAYCPEFNPAARAVFFGATLRHTRAHFIRSILEAVSFMLKRNIELLESTGMRISEVRSLGGGARNPLWLQIKADVLQKPILTIQAEETACLGAAMLGAVASQTYRDLNQAVSNMVSLSHTFIPDREKGAIYQDQYRKYIDLYEHLDPLFR
jgi:xylulokinase